MGRLQRFRRAAAGSATVQTALVMGGILGAMLLVAQGLGSASKRSFESLWISPPHENNASPTTVAGASSGENQELEPGVAGRFAVAMIAAAVLLGVVVCLVIVCRPRRYAPKADATIPPDATREGVRAARFVGKRQQILRVLSRDPQLLWQGGLLVRHLMTREVISVVAEATVPELKALMAREDVRHLLVCDDEGQLVGVLSDRDLRSPKGATAGQIMAACPKSVASDLPLKPAVSMLLDLHVSSLPVVDEGRLVGIMTTTDLAMALQCAMHLLDGEAPCCSLERSI